MLLIEIQNMLSDAVQSDVEHGCSWLNSNAATEFADRYPALTRALGIIGNMESPALTDEEYIEEHRSMQIDMEQHF